MDQAEALVRSVFPWMTPVERLSFVAIRNPSGLAGRLLMACAGIKDKIAFDVCVDEAGAVLGTTGLYRYKRDAHEAAWIAWFCVAPAARGQGVGQQLLDHTVQLARELGYRNVRLYTSTSPGEAAAQRLYEQNGFIEIKRIPGLLTTLILREKTITL